MDSTVKSFEVEIDSLTINLQNIVDTMGYSNSNIPNEMMSILTELFQQSKKIVEIKCGYKILSGDNVFVSGNQITIHGKIFKTERIVSVPLKKMENAALFAATIGSKFDEWSKSAFENGDALEGYIIDLIGSEIAESTADWLEAQIIIDAKNYDMQCSNRYSPGYCGWSVADQHNLFSFFPEKFCGISLTDSALMKPHKSVSGIIGIGREIKRMEYPCDVCKKKDCYKNNLRKETKLT